MNSILLKEIFSALLCHLVINICAQAQAQAQKDQPGKSKPISYLFKLDSIRQPKFVEGSISKHLSEGLDSKTAEQNSFWSGENN